jgi:hypothetical protein
MEVNSQEAEQKIKAVLEINPRSYRGWTDLIRTYNYILDSSFTDIKFLDKNERIFAEERTAVTKKYGVYIVRLERFSNYIGLFHPDKITYTRQLFRYDISVKIINSYKNCLSVATDDDKSQCQSSYQKYVVQSKKEAIEFFNSYLKEEDKIRRDKYLRKNKLSNLPDFFAETEKRSAHDNSYYLVDQLL